MVNLFPYFWERKINNRNETGQTKNLNIKNTLIYG